MTAVTDKVQGLIASTPEKIAGILGAEKLDKVLGKLDRASGLELAAWRAMADALAVARDALDGKDGISYREDVLPWLSTVTGKGTGQIEDYLRARAVDKTLGSDYSHVNMTALVEVAKLKGDDDEGTLALRREVLDETNGSTVPTRERVKTIRDAAKDPEAVATARTNRVNKVRESIDNPLHEVLRNASEGGHGIVLRDGFGMTDLQAVALAFFNEGARVASPSTDRFEIIETAGRSSVEAFQADAADNDGIED